MAKTIQRSAIQTGQLEPLLKAAALRRLQYEPAQRPPAAPKASKVAKSPAKKRKKA